MNDTTDYREVERWGRFELTLHGPRDGNPFLDVQLSAQFRYKHRVVEMDGFYDGEGVYRVRFMPDTLGRWSYLTRSNADGLDGVTGEFTCVEPSAGNHGPVGVRNTYHFAYADGTPYFPVGTTCYAWVHQGTALEEQTLATLRNAPFNKLHMCVFPKDYTYNENEPEFYPFGRAGQGAWDLARFNPAFFQYLEQRVGDLLELGIQADVILFHPYDRWGFATMDAEADECRYEGNVPHRWGNLTAQEMVHQFWLGTVHGGYVGHGETYLHPEDVLWWSKGGVLRGQSPERIAFYRRILEEGPPGGLDPTDGGAVNVDWFPTAGKAGEYYLTYFGTRQPARTTFRLPEGGRYEVEVIDTWEMTITPLEGTFEGRFTVELPGKPYVAVRVRRWG